MAVSPRDRRKAFEDKVLGPNAVRIDGNYEIGLGSKYASLPDSDKATLAALDELCAADEEMSTAASALAAAEVRMEAARAAADLLNPQPAPPKSKSKPVIVQPDGSWSN